jgi:hypothetical protein
MLGELAAEIVARLQWKSGSSGTIRMLRTIEHRPTPAS